MKKNLRLSTLSYTLFMCYSALDSVEDRLFSFDDYYKGLDKRTLFEDLEDFYGEYIDLSLITSDKQKKDLFLEALESVRPALEDRERRKVGIERNGTLLFCAYITELIQQFGWDTEIDKKHMEEVTY